MADPISFVRTEEQAMLASTLRDLIESRGPLGGTRQAGLTDTAINRDVWVGLREMGLIGLHVPEEYGGAGYSFVETAIVFEELGRSVVPVPLLSNVMAIEAILHAGSEDQKRATIPAFATGEKLASLALFERAHDLSTVETSAEREGEAWRLEGNKMLVIDAPNADVFVVSATTPDGLGLFMVDRNDAGVSVVNRHALDASRPLGDLKLDGVLLGGDACVSVAGSDRAISSAIDLGVVALAQEQVGGAQRCLEMSIDYAQSRFQFGRAIGSFQAIKHMCADMLVAVEHARSAASYAARVADDAEEFAIAVPIAKSVCSDAYVKVAGDTIQVHGGIGFTWDHDAHLFFKRAKSTALLLGSVDYHRDRLAEAIDI